MLPRQSGPEGLKLKERRPQKSEWIILLHFPPKGICERQRKEIKQQLSGYTMKNTQESHNASRTKIGV